MPKKKVESKILTFEGHISNLNYTPTFSPASLPAYEFNLFDINTASPSGLVKFDQLNNLAYSKWVTPKRTRSYPFARIYNTYHTAGKIVTVIPIIKDEGSDTNNDRINFITLSWLNLMNVYIILAWYDKADKINDLRITNQKFNNAHVKKKLEEIKNYKLDAHHWNKEHFINEFPTILRSAVKSYKDIASSLNVKLHSPLDHEKFLKGIILDKDQNKLDLEKFKIETLKRSQLAAVRESKTSHKRELLNKESAKCIFQIENNLGGKYHLTADEVVIVNKDEILIQECKNSTTGHLPSEEDIKDGLFKLILLSNIETLKLNGKTIKFKPRLRMTGDLKGNLILPAEQEDVDFYSEKNKFSLQEKKILDSLNIEANKNNLTVVIGE